MKNILLVFAGSGAGGVLRYLVGKAFSGAALTAFPWATLAVNIGAGFLIGILMGMGQSRRIISPSATLLLTTGFCGGLSTFSTFSAESVSLLQREQYAAVLVYILASFAGSITATFAGLYFTK